jgi:thiosulfate dehydrogenase
MRAKRSCGVLLAAAASVALGLWFVLPVETDKAVAHQAVHTPEQLKLFDQLFMKQVEVGDLLFHGDKATERRLGVNLSNTGMACAMCHPYASDTHPHEFPKWQEQMSKFATLRDMINWCIEKPNEGEVLEADSEAMKALEAYITWSNRNSPLRPGTH